MTEKDERRILDAAMKDELGRVMQEEDKKLVNSYHDKVKFGTHNWH